jgi:hypothetical protein
MIKMWVTFGLWAAAVLPVQRHSDACLCRDLLWYFVNTRDHTVALCHFSESLYTAVTRES